MTAEELRARLVEDCADGAMASELLDDWITWEIRG